MDTNLIDIKFARMGARLKSADRPARRNRTSGVVSLDVHADHATITLHGWHRVLMNTEGQSKAIKNVAFLD